MEAETVAVCATICEVCKLFVLVADLVINAAVPRTSLDCVVFSAVAAAIAACTIFFVSKGVLCIVANVAAAATAVVPGKLQSFPCCKFPPISPVIGSTSVLLTISAVPPLLFGVVGADE